MNPGLLTELPVHRTEYRIQAIPETWIPEGMTCCNLSDSQHNYPALVARTPRTLEIIARGVRCPLHLVASDHGEGLLRITTRSTEWHAPDFWKLEFNGQTISLQSSDSSCHVRIHQVTEGRLQLDVYKSDGTSRSFTITA